MGKSKSVFVCQDCGMSYPKWTGRCDSCGKWNTVVEECIDVGSVGGASSAAKLEFFTVHDEHLSFDRIETGISEFDRVCGGGLVPGSVTLIGGDPGIGKSTLMLQIADRFDRCYYFSGEESVPQISNRARRLGVANENLSIAATNNLADIFASIDKKDKNAVIVVDSIQTLTLDAGMSSAGSVTQIRTCTQEIINFAKTNSISFIIIGHVTKEGFIAGPKLLEHMVDSVFYFEGERINNFRILRSIKNRYGPCDEIGVFEMSGFGLVEISNPSKYFINKRANAIPGVVNFVSIEGTRPILVEIQALIADSGFAAPRRSVVGIDLNRLHMVIAVLDSICKISLSKKDVYISVVGGVKVSEPAADLAVATALMSVVKKRAIDLDTVVVGEIGLTGEIRPVFNIESRLKEAEKLGMKKIILSKNSSALSNAEIEKNYFDNILLVLNDLF